MTAPSPIRARAEITACGPIATPTPRIASGATTAVGCTPGSSRGGAGAKRAASWVKAALGEATWMRVPVSLPASCSETRIAPAWLARATASYLALPRKESWSGWAERRSATPVITVSAPGPSTLPPTSSARTRTVAAVVTGAPDDQCAGVEPAAPAGAAAVLPAGGASAFSLVMISLVMSISLAEAKRTIGAPLAEMEVRSTTRS